jgi:hypothetical protein
LEGLANAVRGCASSPWEILGRILSDKLLRGRQELDGIVSLITELGDQVLEQFPLRVVLGHAGVLPEM